MALKRPQAQGKRMIDNARTIVTEYRFAPGAETGWHKHGHDYIVVPMTTGNLLIEGPGGTETLAPIDSGRAIRAQEGVEHNVVNPNATEFVFIEIEMK